MTARTCPCICITGNRCELDRAHVGMCKYTYPNGAEEQWVRRTEGGKSQRKVAKGASADVR
jgi:hypothetical protein